jgi:hypothetical protein
MEKGFRTIWDPDLVMPCDWTYLYIRGVKSCIMLCDIPFVYMDVVFSSTLYEARVHDQTKLSHFDIQRRFPPREC